MALPQIVNLPCDHPEEWAETKRFLLLLSNVHSTSELNTLDESFRSSPKLDEYKKSSRTHLLRGLARYLDKYCKENERKKFFRIILPHICRLATQLPSLVPEGGIPFILAQQDSTVYISKKLVASLLANCFLCTFTLGFTFVSFFEYLYGSHMYKMTQTSQANRLKCILFYFEKLAENRFKLNGFLKIHRQVLAPLELPALDHWRRNSKPLCSFRIEGDKKIEDCGTLTLQVDFANSFIGGGALKNGCVQEEIRFTICPELIVSMLVLEPMESNEAVLIKGFERCSNYRGYSSSFTCAGECHDYSQRDDLGAPMCSLVAIDALEIDEFSNQYSMDSVLRELNKAYAGFYSKDHHGDLQRESIPDITGKTLVIEHSQSVKDGSSHPMETDRVPMTIPEESTSPKELSFPVPQFVTPSTTATPRDLSDLSSNKASSVTHERGSAGDIPGYADLLSQSLLTRAVESLGVGDSQEVDTQGHVQGGEGKQTSSVQFMLAINRRESPGSNVSNLSQLGSELDPSAISEVDPSILSTISGHSYGSDSSEPTDIGEYAESVSKSILKQLLKSLSQGEDGSSTDGKLDDPDTARQPSSLGDFTDSSTSLTSSTSAKERKKNSTEEPTVVQQVAKGSSPGEESFADTLSEQLISAATHQQLYVEGITLKSVMAQHLLPTDRIKRAPSLDSGRHSAMWSSANTIDEDSSPPSPSELDTIAIEYANTVSEYAELLVFKCLADVVRKLTGKELNESFEDRKVATPLHTQREIDGSHDDQSTKARSRWVDYQRALLRPVVTGNWGCGAFGGNAQLKSLIQWLAASASGRPEMVYCSFRERRLRKIKEIIKLVESRGMTVGQLASYTLKCCEILGHPRYRYGDDLFGLLIKQLST